VLVKKNFIITLIAQGFCHWETFQITQILELCLCRAYVELPTRFLLFSFSYWRHNPLWVCILQPCSGAIASSHTRFLDHTQRRATVSMTPLDEPSVRRRDLYLPTHTTHNRQISMPPVGFEPMIAVGERP
jgi:hypothetical protein